MTTPFVPAHDRLGKFAASTQSSPEPASALKQAPTLVAVRAQIRRAETARLKADAIVKQSSVQAVEILSAGWIPGAVEVEFHREYNEDSFTVIRANDMDGDPIWEAYEPADVASLTAAQRGTRSEMNGLMVKVGVDAPAYLSRIDDLIGETVVVRF